MSGISRAQALALAREYFTVKDEQLDDVIKAVLRDYAIEWPLTTWNLNRHVYMTEAELRTKLASTRALFAEMFRVVV